MHDKPIIGIAVAHQTYAMLGDDIPPPPSPLTTPPEENPPNDDYAEFDEEYEDEAMREVGGGRGGRARLLPPRMTVRQVKGSYGHLEGVNMC
jgi:hypothetical protein